MHLVPVLSPRVVGEHIVKSGQLFPKPSLKYSKGVLVTATSDIWQSKPELSLKRRATPVIPLSSQRDVQSETFDMVYRVLVEDSFPRRPSIWNRRIRQKTNNHPIYAPQDRAEPKDFIVWVSDDKA
jgi:hypothetical protein